MRDLAYGGRGGYEGASGRRQSQVIVSAQATPMQRAGGSLTLQVTTDQEVPDARVALRPARPGGRETPVWQGKLNRSLSNSLDIPVGPSAAMPGGSPQELIVSGSPLNRQAFYLFSPSTAAGEPGPLMGTADRLKPKHAPGTVSGTWVSILQTMASKRNLYILAPAGFPIGQRVRVAPDLSDESLAHALKRIGYEFRPQEGAMTIEPSTPAAAPPRPTRPLPPGRARRWRG